VTFFASDILHLYKDRRSGWQCNLPAASFLFKQTHFTRIVDKRRRGVRVENTHKKFSGGRSPRFTSAQKILRDRQIPVAQGFETKAAA
jgi:hypothetical protein